MRLFQLLQNLYQQNLAGWWSSIHWPCLADENSATTYRSNDKHFIALSLFLKDFQQRNLVNVKPAFKTTIHGKLEEFCNLFDLSNLIKSNTCFTKTHSSKADLILTNSSNSFQKSGTTETGLSDFHKLISTFFKSHFSRLSPKAIYYRNYKNFDESKFIEDLIYTDFSL